MRAFVPAFLLSPDYNPIEEALGKMKGLIRKVEARSREVLAERPY